MSANYDSIDPLDGRYFNQSASMLSERSRIAYQASVEVALAQTLAEYNICKPSAAKEIANSAKRVTAEAVYAEESITKHDIKALVNCIKANISDAAKPYVHFGATSYDIVATANALQMKDAITLLVLPELKRLLKVLIDNTGRYADVTQVGRTHGQHAVPITFGYALAEYVSRLGESYLALHDLSQQLKGKFSGAVGAYNGLSLFVDDPISFERDVLAKLDLKPAPYATQITPPESMVRLIDELGITAGIMANLAHDMRHLQRTEINEIREKFETGQTGSSTMAHKRNPWNFENVVSMSKQVLSQLVNANLNLSSEHQRDLTDSASSRFYTIVPASVASMASRLSTIMQKIEVDTESMERNLQLSSGAIAAEPLYLLFEKHGHTSAHEFAKSLAHRALQQKQSLAELVQSDKVAKKYWVKFSVKEQGIIKDPASNYTGLAAKRARSIARTWRTTLHM